MNLGVLGVALVTGVVLFTLGAVARRHKRFGNRLRFTGMGLGCLLVIGTIVGFGLAAAGGSTACVGRC